MAIKMLPSAETELEGSRPWRHVLCICRAWGVSRERPFLRGIAFILRDELGNVTGSLFVRKEERDVGWENG